MRNRLIRRAFLALGFIVLCGSAFAQSQTWQPESVMQLNNYAAKTTYISLTASSGAAARDWNGTDGRYTIQVYYPYDVGGESRLDLKINGILRGSKTILQVGGVLEVANVDIRKGDPIRIIGTKLNAKGLARVNSVNFIRKSDIPNQVAPPPTSRDPLKWPFAQDSIWNMPIGSGAIYKPANLILPSGSDKDDWNGVPYIDHDILVLKPSAPRLPLYRNSTGWKPEANTGGRCTRDNFTVVAMIPWPLNYIVPSSMGNNSTAVLLEDGRTALEIQPSTRCEGYNYVTSLNTSLYNYGMNDIRTGDGIRGSHGGTGLSALGGTLRIGELTQPGHPPRHVLKMALNTQSKNYCRNKLMSECKRWPAKLNNPVTQTCTTGECWGYGMRNGVAYKTNVKSGSLFAIHKNVNIYALGLETEPGRMMAWTLQNYGMYDDDSTAHWPAANFAIGAEESPDGDFDTAFENAWGYSFKGRVRDRGTNPFLRDMEKIMRILQVVDNNGPNSIGGGGTPRQPLAPPFK